jgi:outer membrane protein TolC
MPDDGTRVLKRATASAPATLAEARPELPFALLAGGSPPITFSAGVSTMALSAGHLFDPSGLKWSITSGLTQPIFNGGMRQAERRPATDLRLRATNSSGEIMQRLSQ